MSEMKEYTLRDFFSLRARIGWQGLRSDEFQTEGPYLVTGTDFENGRVNWDNCYHVSVERFEQDKGIQLHENDLLVTKDGTVGKTAFVTDCPKKATLNSHIFLVRPLTNHVDPAYLYYVLNSNIFDSFLNNILTGTTIKGLTQEKFYKFSFAVPNIEEQRRIVEVLRAVDEAIEDTQRIVEKYENVRIGLLRDALHPDCDSQIYDFKAIANNITKKRKTSLEDVCINLDSLESGTGRLLFSPHEDIKSDKIIFTADDILFGKLRPYLKKYLYANFDGLCSSEIMVFRANGIRSKYLYYIISSEDFIAYNNAKTFGTRMPRTSWKIISKYQVAVPSIIKQDNVIERVESLDTKINKERQCLSKLTAIKQGLLQDLLIRKK